LSQHCAMTTRPKGPKESPSEAFERLKQAFDTLKAQHIDPWCWHDYLSDEPELEEEDDLFDDDPELFTKKPKPRSNPDRLKQHLLACNAELQRAAHAADMCFFHICTSPEQLRECCIILGSGGDIDADLLGGGDVSPQKIIAALQGKLDLAHEKINLLEDEVENLKTQLVDSRYQSEDRWIKWQRTAMHNEEATTRLHWTTVGLNEALDREKRLQAAYLRLRLEMVRASRLMIYHGTLRLRGIHVQYKKENLFYSFMGFITVLQKEKEERIRAEHEAKRDAVEFALRYEVRFLLKESKLRSDVVEKLTLRVNRFHVDRRELACRILYKHRPHEVLEYFLWVWELWQPIRRQLILEKYLDKEEAERAAATQMLIHTSAQIPMLSKRVDILKRELAMECTAHLISKRDMMSASANQVANMAEHMQVQRLQEQTVLSRLHELDCEEKDEKIALLEREICEDKHIAALRNMVIDLEVRLRKALDHRKQLHYVVPPGTGPRCVSTNREITYRGWKLPQPLPQASPSMSKSHSAAALLSVEDSTNSDSQHTSMGWQKPPKAATFSTQWR